MARVVETCAGLVSLKPFCFISVPNSRFIILCLFMSCFNPLVHLNNASHLVTVGSTDLKNLILQVFFHFTNTLCIDELIVLRLRRVINARTRDGLFLSNLEHLSECHLLLFILPEQSKRAWNHDKPKNKPTETEIITTATASTFRRVRITTASCAVASFKVSRLLQIWR